MQAENKWLKTIFFINQYVDEELFMLKTSSKPEEIF